MTPREMEEAVRVAKEWIAWTDYLALKPSERLRLKESAIPILSDNFDEMNANQAINVIAKALLAATAELERMRAVYEAAVEWHRCAQSDAGLNGACGRHDRHLFRAVTTALDAARGGGE